MTISTFNKSAEIVVTHSTDKPLKRGTDCTKSTNTF